MGNNRKEYQKYIANLSRSGLTIYDHIEIGNPDLWIPATELEAMLGDGLKGLSLLGLPLRTRSKVVNEAICKIMGYPVPRRFQRTKPRFPGQQFDKYIQKADNLQIWNDEVDPTRRYVIIRVSRNDSISRVRVIGGDSLALLDTTGTLTQKCQARVINGKEESELISLVDTDNIVPLLDNDNRSTQIKHSPIDDPVAGNLMPIALVFKRLKRLVGREFADSGFDQERNRGAQLHRVVCAKLGYKEYRDEGRFPDIRNQLLEIKLQLSPTIDLGLVRPNSQDPLDIARVNGREIRHCDVRYAVFSGETDGVNVKLTHFYLTTGEDFFHRFPQFQGKIINKKLQIPLPTGFFE